MLLKFTEPDMLNTVLIDVPSGRPKYTILSRASYIQSKDKVIIDVASRTTAILNARGRTIATIEWTGREKRSGGLVRIMDDEPVEFPELFDGCDSVKTAPDHLVIPSRLGFVWVATRSSLIVCHPETREAVGRFHERCVQLRNGVTNSPIPRVGNSYLEFTSLPEEVLAELLVDYIFMNIMRRTRFDLPRYQFPLVDECEEGKQSIADVLGHMKESFSRRTANLRRNMQ
ncbi:hypothetical protein DFH11DRAFT_1541526 [Phellopilus nigrolimitatus]|nr:hypothetical protein DFH11DRAFT_1541526 [Phellopilus nigrolimitatus]